MKKFFWALLGWEYCEIDFVRGPYALSLARRLRPDDLAGACELLQLVNSLENDGWVLADRIN